MFTTLLCLLYPPLKGFSHSLDHVRIRDKPLPAAPPRGLKLSAFDRLHIEGYLNLPAKGVFIKNIGALEAFLSLCG